MISENNIANTVYFDYLGSPIKIGDLGIRVNHAAVTYDPFRQFKVVKIDPTRRYDPIGIKVEGHNRRTWVGPSKIIIQGSLNIKLESFNKKVIIE